MAVQCDQAARKHAAVLFGQSNGPLIAAALQGLMGSLWVEDAPEPACGLICNGDVAFFAGDSGAKGAEALLERFAEVCRGRPMIANAGGEGWAERIRGRFGEQAKPGERYAMRLPSHGFDQEKLWEYVGSIRPPYRLVAIGAREYADALKEPWSRDFCSQFAGFPQFEKIGLGYVAMLDSALVSGASSYVACAEGMEIQVDTLEAHRRQGLATACSARLILACLERGLLPHWDAANRASVALAEKLGYCLERIYPILEVDLSEADAAKPVQEDS